MESKKIKVRIRGGSFRNRMTVKLAVFLYNIENQPNGTRLPNRIWAWTDDTLETRVWSG